MISENIKSITQRITICCEKLGRSPSSIKVVCVGKYANAQQIEEVLASGIRDIGENKAQDLISKYNTLGDKAVWHFIGHLQTNKVRDVVKIASLIHSVDSARLASTIDKEAKSIGKAQDILLQVNASGESSKFGVSPEGFFDLAKEIAKLENVRIKGLMTIAPETKNPEEARPSFRILRELNDKLYHYPFLSMGMSGDFEVAIEEGANIVRIGSAIFKTQGE